MHSGGEGSGGVLCQCSGPTPSHPGHPAAGQEYDQTLPGSAHGISALERQLYGRKPTIGPLTPYCKQKYKVMLRWMKTLKIHWLTCGVIFVFPELSSPSRGSGSQHAEIFTPRPTAVHCIHDTGELAPHCMGTLPPSPLSRNPCLWSCCGCYTLMA